MNFVKPEYENLINSLIKDGYLKTPEIIEAFKAIDRLDFVPEEYKNEAYINAPLSIGFGQTISQPLVVAFMLELLEPKAGEKILDIGAGSGWTLALLAQLVGENGRVIGIERIPELKEMAEKNISKYNFIDPVRNKPLQAAAAVLSAKRISNGVEKKIVQVIAADGSKGYKKEAPYDKIIAGAAAETETPVHWKRQLKIGGRIVAPAGNSIIVIDKIGKNKYTQKEYFGFSFVPLIKD